MTDMTSGSVIQQAVDLHLFLYDRPLHPELFRLHASYRAAQGRYHADIWLVGMGHVVTVTTGQSSLIEAVVVDSEELPSRGALTRFRMKGERDLERRSPDGWHYMVSSQLEQMEEPLYKSVHWDLLRHGAKRGCMCTYDQWSDGDMAPFSYVDYEARNGEFHVHAFHAFPHERTVVKTQSIFELPTTP